MEDGGWRMDAVCRVVCECPTSDFRLFPVTYCMYVAMLRVTRGVVMTWPPGKKVEVSDVEGHEL